MQNLDLTNWKEFRLSDYFDIFAGHYYYPDEYMEGTTPYLSASNINNGIASYIDLSPDFEGNCIVTGKVGCTAFYQPEPFCATSDVNVFKPKFKMSQLVGLFITSVINFSENYKWTYGRQCRVGNSKMIIVKLPANDRGEPDWQYMEEYMRMLHSNPLKTSRTSSPMSLQTYKWKEYKFGDLISSITKATAHTKDDVEEVPFYKDNIPYVSRTEKDNSVDMFVRADDFSGMEEGNAIIIGDTTSTIFYQKDPFITGDHIIVIRADWLNIYTGLFIVTILNQERYRYSYGRAYKKNLIRNTNIMLPSKSNNRPDWAWMEQYIKSLPMAEYLPK